ncbi:tyrosine-type recombinase/integrase (plasmid) [Tundrisphaera lichenicola]|uniref:tyrosine-type recombinase/integrase n=1 Tax=Tundrisphaera lichenicola TaxID=2029860 RepID=UPI003EBE1BB2
MITVVLDAFLNIRHPEDRWFFLRCYRNPLRFAEKGGKSREIPVRHDLEQFLLAYIEAAKITEGPLFRPAMRRTKQLKMKAMSGIDICRMMKRRLKAAGLPDRFSPHSFRVATVTDLLEQNVPLEDVQHLAGHADPRTTRLYDRRRKKVTRNIVERISICPAPGPPHECRPHPTLTMCSTIAHVSGAAIPANSA